MERVRVVQNPSDLLSDTPGSFTGTLIEPFEVTILSRFNPWTGKCRELERRMSTLRLRTPSEQIVDATMVPQFELTGDWRDAGVEHRTAGGSHARLRAWCPEAMAGFAAPSSWLSRLLQNRHLWALTIPAGTEVRVECFDSYAELRPRGDYRAARSVRIRVRARRLVVIDDERPVAEDALAPAARSSDPIGWVTVAALALGPMLALAFAFAGFVQVGRSLTLVSPLVIAAYAGLAEAFALDMRLAAKRAVKAERSETPTGPPKLW